MAGHMFGLDATACFEAKCAEVLRDRVDGGHLEALRVMLLLGEARLVGISDAEVDPFSHASKAQEELVRLVTATDVAQAASPAVWRAHYDAGMEVVQNGLDRDPRRIAASLLQLAAQVTREAQAVGREMVGQGLAPPGSAAFSLADRDRRIGFLHNRRPASLDRAPVPGKPSGPAGSRWR